MFYQRLSLTAKIFLLPNERNFNVLKTYYINRNYNINLNLAQEKKVPEGTSTKQPFLELLGHTYYFVRITVLIFLMKLGTALQACRSGYLPFPVIIFLILTVVILLSVSNFLQTFNPGILPSVMLDLHRVTGFYVFYHVFPVVVVFIRAFQLYERVCVAFVRLLQPGLLLLVLLLPSYLHLLTLYKRPLRNALLLSYQLRPGGGLLEEGKSTLLPC